MTPRRPPAPRPAGRPRPVARPAAPASWLSLLQPGLLLLAVALAWFGQEQWRAHDLSTGAWFWLGAAAAAALAGWRQPERREEPGAPPRWELWLLGGIVLTALAARGWRLVEIPNGYFFDEATNSLLGLQILKNPFYVPMFGPSDVPAPTLYHYLIAVALKVGGISRLASKWVPVLAGTLTVIPVYFVARRLVSVPVALASALLLAFMRWHVNFSRINFIGIMTPLLAAMAVYFLLRGLETRNRWHMALSGIAVSLGLYTYFASNLIPFILGPYLALQLAWERDFLARHWRGLLIFLGASLLVFAPLGYFAATQPNRFFARNGQVLIFNHVPPDQAWPALWRNVRTTLLMFHYFGDTNGRHNLPEEPMLDPVTGVLAGLGLVWALTHPRNRHAVLLVLWLLVSLVPGFLTIEAPQGYRCIGAIVPVILLAAYGLERVWQTSRDLAAGTRMRAWLPALVLAPIVAVSGFLNVDTYFSRQARSVAAWSEFSAAEAAMGNLLHELGPQTHAYISAQSYNYPTITFLGYPYVDAEPFQLTSTIPSNDPGSKNLAYLLLPIHDGALELLRYYYPGGRERAYDSPFDFTLFTAYLVDRSEVEATRGLRGEFRGTDGRTAEVRENEPGRAADPGLRRLAWPVEARWTGSLRVPAAGQYAFGFEGADHVHVRVDGRPAGRDVLDLAQGLHRLEVRARLSEPGRARLNWRQGTSGLWSTIPAVNLIPREEVHGLTGTYYRSGDWTGEPVTRRIDPLLSLIGHDFPLAAPFSVRWEGTLDAPVSGEYGFGTLSNQFSKVWIDGRLVVDNQRADAYEEGQIRLASGTHDIRVEYQKLEGSYPRIILYWIPPGNAKAKVPFTSLRVR